MAPGLSLKDRISSPLEAGTSIADGQYLPAYLNPALEFASKRLLRKGVNATLLVVRRDYQLPTSPLTSPCSPSFSSVLAASSPASATSTPSRPTFGLKQFVRSYSSNSEAPIRERILFSPFDQFRNGCASPAISETSVASGSTASTASTAESTFSRRRWPTSPTNGSLSVPMTPATPFSISSSSITASTDTGSAVSGAILQNPGQFGIKLVHIGSGGVRDERVLAQTIEKTAKKYKLGPEWLPQAVSPSALDLPIDVVHRSLVQYETLFTSENLTLLSVDHLYTFRTALQSYSRTHASSRLEDAVDELRRLFLANGRKKLLKSALLAAYRWLDPVTDSALSDVCRMYSRAYGGLDLETGVENDMESHPAWPLRKGEDSTVHELSAEVPRVLETIIASPPYSEYDDAELQLPQHSPSVTRSETQLLEQWDLSPEEKEFLFDSRFDDDDLDDLPDDLAEELKELDAIEAWYREVQINVDVDLSMPRSFDICIPPPPPPPPVMHIGLSTTTPAAIVIDDSEIEGDDDDGIQSEAEMEERRTTPKMAAALPLPLPPVFILPPAAPSGVATRPMMPLMSLRLQTSFDPKPKARRRSPTQAGDVQRQGILLATAPPEEEEEEDEDLTARPKSAIVSQGTQWNTASIAAGLQSIDTIMNGGGSCRTPIDSRLQALRQEDRHAAPITPNGYDDISPITRGEWGFFMNGGELGQGKGRRKAAVEMC